MPIKLHRQVFFCPISQFFRQVLKAMRYHFACEMTEKRKPQILSRSRKAIERKMERRRDEDTPVTKLDNKIKPIDSSLRYSSYLARVLALNYLDHRGCPASCYAILRPSKNSTVVFFNTYRSR